MGTIHAQEGLHIHRKNVEIDTKIRSVIDFQRFFGVIWSFVCVFFNFIGAAVKNKKWPRQLSRSQECVLLNEI